MKKTIISLAIAAGMAASGAASAEVYGVLHASIDSADTGSNVDSMEMKSQTSAIGVKGSEDLGDGMKAFYKAEFQVDITEAGALTGRDQYIGLKGGMGTVKFGTMSSNYKQMGGTVDPMYRTSLEGRGAMRTQSNMLHGGAGRLRGRMTDLVQYSSPKMGGMQLVVNTTFDAANTAGPAPTDIDETLGVGFRYESKDFSFYFDMIDMADAAGPGSDTVNSESATKVGGSFETGPVKLGIQLEMSEKLTGNDYTHISVDYTMDANNSIYLTIGQMGDIYNGTTNVSDTGSTSIAVMYDHKMSKATDLYVGYGSRDDDAAASKDYSVLTAGMRVKF
ncbi:MAG: porin [Gammaproteobacteria bacterium]|nr:porin [Gammaproteobacteria bacterium]